MIEGLKPYAENKESGLPWLGRCPKHWNVRRTKILFHERVQKGFPNEPLLAATQTKGVVKKEDYETRTVTAQKDLHLLKLVEVGDYVISLRSFQGGIEVAHCRGIISPAYTVLKPQKQAESRYYSHFFKAKPFIDSLSLFVTGIREGQNIDYERLSRAEMPMPPEDEQTAIVRFLDHANRKIDGFIRAKRKLIGLLNEQKQAIIHRAVTRGLHPDVPLKPSGIPWLGDIPQHWEVRRLKTIVTKIDQGVSPLASGFLAEGDSWGVLKSGCVNHGVFRQTEHKQLAKSFDIDPSIVVRVGDVLISRACGSPKLVGSVGKVRALDYKLILSDKTFRAAFRPIVDSDFMVYAMNGVYYRQQVEQSISGADGMANNLPLSELSSFVFALPPLAEAAAIASHLDAELARFTTAIARTEREIALMQEYRTRLTADLVTGKLDVREAAAKLPEPPAEPAAEVVVEEELLEETEPEETA